MTCVPYTLIRIIPTDDSGGFVFACFGDRISYSPGWPGTLYAAQAGLELSM